ncbi:hypothetical protein SARC_11263 [Sphaeroforma arctica JP610]|uniref:Uncharacterized protein n=1 Tax=Sphaeroforma arctica JP610 TaxID=667725 RepID=A0A0L0FJM0_9EUKA|nr:hypothetical protein SARC_11263 [Sphaeroforma arctica JP610]KNC76223.1 hypothetical protein SARC_11263 [Sphaeroforma arctica JP610]|eukprot:XP_014150125.1 hypothetical protein SARC_11263 [Sphaeroforma arctica JP610]
MKVAIDWGDVGKEFAVDLGIELGSTLLLTGSFGGPVGLFISAVVSVLTTIAFAFIGGLIRRNKERGVLKDLVDQTRVLMPDAGIGFQLLWSEIDKMWDKHGLERTVELIKERLFSGELLEIGELTDKNWHHYKHGDEGNVYVGTPYTESFKKIEGDDLKAYRIDDNGYSFQYTSPNGIEKTFSFPTDFRFQSTEELYDMFRKEYIFANEVEQIQSEIDNYYTTEFMVDGVSLPGSVRGKEGMERLKRQLEELQFTRIRESRDGVRIIQQRQVWYLKQHTEEEFGSEAMAAQIKGLQSSDIATATTFTRKDTNGNIVPLEQFMVLFMETQFVSVESFTSDPSWADSGLDIDDFEQVMVNGEMRLRGLFKDFPGSIKQYNDMLWDVSDWSTDDYYNGVLGDDLTPDDVFDKFKETLDKFDEESTRYDSEYVEKVQKEQADAIADAVDAEVRLNKVKNTNMYKPDVMNSARGNTKQFAVGYGNGTNAGGTRQQ